MDNHEERPDREGEMVHQEHLDAIEETNAALEQPPDTSEDEYDYDREVPLDSVTVSSNRRRSKYVFMTLCFLLGLMLLYTSITNASAGNSGDWFPLVGAMVLGILGVTFLRSSDTPPGAQSEAENAFHPSAENGTGQDKKLSPFEELVQEALATIPEEFHDKMENVMVRVQYEPDEETRQRVGLKAGYTLLGLYEGVPLTTYGRDYAPYPEVITIYQRPIEEFCHHNATRIREQVRKTVLHEIAHHFGMGHEEMPIWVQ
jgi:predicted Zn-dependent protease with MMP-like domain